MSSTEPTIEHINDFFRQIAWKYLKMVDLPFRGSNAHEIGGVNKLHSILGSVRRGGINTRWRIFDEDGEVLNTFSYSGLTWYDSREKNPDRSPEWRLYYPHGKTPLDDAREDDLLLYMQPGDLFISQQHFDLLFYVIPRESTLHNEVLWALGLDSVSERLQLQTQTRLEEQGVDVLRRNVLLTLEPELKIPVHSATLREKIWDAFSDFLNSPFDVHFPTTKELAEFAQSNVDVSSREEPDIALVNLLDVESRAFYELESALLLKRLEERFESVDDFISFSLSVQNRRKSRRGRSLENHLAYILEKNGLRFEEQVLTEHSTVDFLFPGGDAYESYKSSGMPPVMMLAAKSSCKDRWRQVVNEAQALDKRYLFTLEANISSNQTAEMGDSAVSLVVPDNIVSSYEKPGTEILNLESFIGRVRHEVEKANV